MAKITEKYIAGFFDGEGHATIGKTKMMLGFSNTDRRVLQRIQHLLGAGSIYAGKLHGAETHVCYKLSLQHHDDVLRVAKQLLPHSIVKREALLKLVKAIESKQWRVSGDVWRQRLPKYRLATLYWKEKLSSPVIARRFQTSSRQILNLMEDYGIPRRTLSQSTTLYWKGRN